MIHEFLCFVRTFNDHKVLYPQALNSVYFSHKAEVLKCLPRVIQILNALVQEAEHCGCVLHKPGILTSNENIYSQIL